MRWEIKLYTLCFVVLVVTTMCYNLNVYLKESERLCLCTCAYVFADDAERPLRILAPPANLAVNQLQSITTLECFLSDPGVTITWKRSGNCSIYVEGERAREGERETE